MKDTSPEDEFGKIYQLPYLLGVFLAVNAVRDVCLIVDGANCVMAKADLIAGNHDLFSTLFSETGRHRVICTMVSPLSPQKNPEKKLAALLNSVAGSGQFGAALVTGLPFCRLAGMDYEGVARSISSGAPVTDVPSNSMGGDWLDGYELALDALARAVRPAKAGRRGKNKVALVGYMMDRNEYDHAANLKELARLLGLAGLDLVSVWPSGGSFAGLERASGASLIVSLPYGRKAARTLAAKYGSSLLETGLPMGLKGTTAWLSAVRRAAGLKGSLPEEILAEERRTAKAVTPALRVLLHKKVLFAGDPHLCSAFASFARELCVSVPVVFLDSLKRPLGARVGTETAMFSPSAAEALAAARGRGAYERPDLAVANSFALTEGFADGLPFVELGFPSYGHHCLSDEPFLGFSGARTLAARLLNSLQAQSCAKALAID